MKKLFNGDLDRTSYVEYLVPYMKDDVFNYCIKNNLSNFSFEQYLQIIDEVCEKYYVYIHIEQLKLGSFKNSIMTQEEAQKSNMKWHHSRTYSCPFSGNIHLLSHRAVTVSKEIFSECLFDNNKIYIDIKTEITQNPESIKKIVLSSLQHFTILTPVNINYLNQVVNEKCESLRNNDVYNKMKNMIALELDIASQALAPMKEPIIKIIG